MGGTPGGGNYRKVFKPNIPGPRSAAPANVDGGEHDSNDSVDRANALALGITPPQNNRSKGMN